MAGESNEDEFPTYADLSRTRDWATIDEPVVVPELGAAADPSRYAETAVLGTGGMGKVVLARDARIGRQVALKVLHGEREPSPEQRARFIREAQVQGQLEHPAIVPVYDIDRRAD